MHFIPQEIKISKSIFIFALFTIMMIFHMKFMISTKQNHSSEQATNTILEIDSTLRSNRSFIENALSNHNDENLREAILKSFHQLGENKLCAIINTDGTVVFSDFSTSASKEILYESIRFFRTTSFDRLSFPSNWLNLSNKNSAFIGVSSLNFTNDSVQKSAFVVIFCPTNLFEWARIDEEKKSKELRIYIIANICFILLVGIYLFSPMRLRP